MSRVSYAMMHPEGAGEMTTAVRKALDGLIATLAMRAGIKRARDPRARDRRQPDHAPPRPRHRPDAARRRAVRAGHGPRGQDHDRGARAARPPGRARVPPAVHRRPRRGRHGRGDPRRAAAPGRADDAGRRRRHQRRDRPRRQAPAPRGIEPDRPRLRGRPDLRRAARRARRDRARPHRPRDARAADPRHRRGRLVGRAGVRGAASPRPASPASAAPGSSRSSPSCSSPASSPRTAWSTASLAARSPRIVADGRTSGYVLHEGVAGGPRVVITQNDVRAIQLAKAALYAGVRLLMDQLEIDAVDEIRLAGAFGSQIDPTHAMILGPRPGLRPRERQVGRQRRRDRGAHRAAVAAPRGARSRASSGASRRSRPRSSRASRSTSWRPWPSRTRRRPSRTSARS